MATAAPTSGRLQRILTGVDQEIRRFVAREIGTPHIAAVRETDVATTLDAA